MANLDLFKIFDADLSQIDRVVYERLQSKVEKFASLVTQLQGLCEVAHSKYTVEDYLQMAFFIYEAKQIHSKSFIAIDQYNPIGLVYRTIEGDPVTPSSNYFLMFQTLEELKQTLLAKLTKITQELYEFRPDDSTFIVDAVYSLLSHAISRNLPKEGEDTVLVTFDSEKYVEDIVQTLS